MPVVLVKGVFMGANLKTQTFNGNSKTSLFVDVYQPEADDTDKMIQLKTDQIELLQVITNDYAMGSVFEAKASVNAYQNKAYFKLLEVV